MKFDFVAKHRGAWPVSLLCEALGVSRGASPLGSDAPGAGAASAMRRWACRCTRALYAATAPTAHAACGTTCWSKARPVGCIVSSGSCASRRCVPGLDGEACPRTVARAAVADNVLDRQFQADAPNQKWVADFTYIWTAEGWLYVAAVLDLYSRRIVGWSMQESMTSQLVVDALMMAVWRRGRPVALLHHSDQGSQYTSEHFQRLLDELGITCSMSRAGEVWDNSAMESFFSSLKIERTARKVYRTRGQARSDVFDYIECFYNPTRRHSTLGYLSPVQFEQAQEA